jgi:hypothetical protein
VDLGHVILGALLIASIASKFRMRHARKFGLTIIVKHEDDAEADTGREPE